MTDRDLIEESIGFGESDDDEPEQEPEMADDQGLDQNWYNI